MTGPFLLSADLGRRMADAVRWVERNRGRLEARRPWVVDVAASGAPTWIRVVGVNDTLGDNRWEYSIVLPDETTDLAINRNEDDNDADKGGPGVLISGLPDGWSYLPIGTLRDETTVEAVYPAWFNAATGYWEFAAENAVDGSCPEPDAELLAFTNLSRLLADGNTVESLAKATEVLEEWCDFASVSSFGFDGLTRQISGTGATGTVLAPSGTYGTQRTGLAQWTTGTTSSGRAGVACPSQMLLGNGWTRLEAAVYIPTLSDASNTYTLALQLANTTTAAASNSRIGFRYSHSLNGGKWLAEADDAGSTTTLDSGIAVAAGQFYELSITVNEDATLASFAIDGAAVGTIATNIPAAAVGPALNIFKSAGTTARTFVADWIYQQIRRSSPS